MLIQSKQHWYDYAAQKSMRMHKPKCCMYTANAAFQITAISAAFFFFFCEMLIGAIVMQFLKRRNLKFEIHILNFVFLEIFSVECQRSEVSRRCKHAHKKRHRQSSDAGQTCAALYSTNCAVPNNSQ